jgi:diguanylate cyclase (GGDEF)-like protein
MAIILSHLMLGFLFALAGLGVGWWLRSHVSLQMSAPAPTNDTAVARDLLSGLHLLSARLAADVGHHNQQVHEVDRQLETRGRDNQVNDLVNQLLKANQAVQSKLSETEGRLDKLSETIEHHANEARTDPLTGLTNRRAFEEEATERLTRFQQSEQTFSLLLLDIDHFKQINDTFGHQAGDEVLRGVGRILRDNLRGRDIVSRFGGEEFTVLLPTTSLQQAKVCGESIRETLAETEFQLADQSISITVSLGIAEVLPYEEMDSLVNRSDQAMYAAKHAGRNRSYWHDGTLVHPVHPPTAVETPTEPNRKRKPSSLRVAPATQTDTIPVNATNRETVETMADAVTASSESRQPKSVSTARNTSQTAMANKTMFCQELRRRIAEWSRGGASFTTALVQLDQYDDLQRRNSDSMAREVMDAVASRVCEETREMDLIAKFDASTFGILFPDAKLRNAICIGERIRKAITQTKIVIDGRTVDATVSLGLTEVADDDDMATLVARAKSQLELAVGSGGNRSSFASGAMTAG